MPMLDGWAPWMRSLAVVRAKCGGLFHVVPMMQREITTALEAVKAGEPIGTLLAGAVLRAHQQIDYPEADTPAMPCVACGVALRGLPRSYAVVVPNIPDPVHATALALCEGCGPDLATIMATVQPCLRVIWPNLRQLGRVMDTSGRA